MNMKYSISEIKESINTKLWLKHPFLAQVATRMGVEYIEKSNRDAWAWNDGLKLVINLGAIDADPIAQDFTLSNILFLVGHEALHTITLTTDRRCGRDPELWNMATDYAINAILIHNMEKGKPCPIGEMPHNDKLKNPQNPDGLIGLYKAKYRDMSAEEIYEDLLQNSPKQKQGQGNGQGKSIDLGGMGSGDGDDQQNSNGNSSGQGNSKQVRQAKDGSGQIGWDDHNSQELSQADKSQLKAELAQAVKSMEQAGMSAGKGSSTIFDRMMEQMFKEPPFDWKGFLDSYLRSYIKDDYTWKRQSRRSQGAGVNLPGNATQKTMKIAIAIDTSGSIGNKELEEFFGHINKIMKSFKLFQVDVWCFSTIVHEDTFKSYTQSDSDITAQKISTTGGTDICANFEYLNEKNPTQYDCLILLTDGYDSLDKAQFNKYPVIWGIIDNKNFEAPKGVLNSIVMPIEFDED
jgi:predicted metal-dependent peptidase